MRKLHLLALGTILLAAPVAAQQSWDAEFGIQGGFSRFKLTGTGSNSTIDMYGVPSAMILGIYPTAPAAFAIFPIGNKLALEPAISFLQVNGPPVGTFPTMAGISLRADYAITTSLYGALGVYSRYAAGSPASSAPYAHFQLGLEAAAGYRLHLGRQLNGRIEVQAVTLKKQDTNAPFNLYSVLFGVSTPLSERPAPAGRRAAAPVTHGAWSPMLGVSAGYANVHLVRGPDLSVLSFPGSGSSSYFGIIGAPTAPSVFGIFPLNDRLAAEIGVDATNLRAPSTTIASFQIAPRADLAFGNHWYGAFGPNVHFVRGTGKLEGQSGVSVAWGYRFHFAGALDGRFEGSYGVNAKRRSSLGTGLPSSVFGLNVGAMMPLK